MTTRFLSVDDGPRITVNAFIKAPTLIPRRILDITNMRFVADEILRPGGALTGGVAKYFESTPLFADDDVSLVEEFGEIPGGRTSLGNPLFVRAVKRALAVKISQEMIDDNDVDAVNTQVQQVSNTMIKAIDNALWDTVLANGSVGTGAATAGWSSGSSKIRFDLATAMQTVADAADASGDDLGYMADTLVINTTTQTNFLSSDDVSKVFIGGNIADQNPLYLGKLGPNFFGLDVYVTRSSKITGKAFVCERKTLGFISDATPLQSTPLYEDRPRETWRSDTKRRSAMALDQPKAGCWITGV
jgi:hypothetical protein